MNDVDFSLWFIDQEQPTDADRARMREIIQRARERANAAEKNGRNGLVSITADVESGLLKSDPVPVSRIVFCNPDGTTMGEAPFSS